MRGRGATQTVRGGGSAPLAPLGQSVRDREQGGGAAPQVLPGGRVIDQQAVRGLVGQQAGRGRGDNRDLRGAHEGNNRLVSF